jgi:hypothetical protein
MVEFRDQATKPGFLFVVGRCSEAWPVLPSASTKTRPSPTTSCGHAARSTLAETMSVASAQDPWQRRRAERRVIASVRDGGRGRRREWRRVADGSGRNQLAWRRLIIFEIGEEFRKFLNCTVRAGAGGSPLQGV